MKYDIVLAGVGGQGILSIAAIIGQAAVSQGLNVKQSEIHGMSQRGGSVVAHLRLGSAAIKSDQIAPGSADMVLAMEPMEALRSLEFLSPAGVLISNTTPVVNIGEYPPLPEVLSALQAHANSHLLDGDQIAKALGSPRAVNMVLLGAMAAFLALPEEILTAAIRELFARKGEAVIASNLKAFAAGRAAVN
ncbi:MAG: indolepyruvate oxidoreductase subunit beta [Oligosphaeraceae bacterium]|nr:indolepyruvate oxidoreductase subunit beta [Oligosphaeraceae bacterium]